MGKYNNGLSFFLHQLGYLVSTQTYDIYLNYTVKGKANFRSKILLLEIFLEAKETLKRLTIAFINSGEIPHLLKTLDGSVTKTVDRIDCGLWDQTIPMFIFITNFHEIDTFLSNKYFVRHSNIRIISSNSRGLSQIQYDVWQQVWSQPLISIKQNRFNVGELNPKLSFNFHEQEVKNFLNELSQSKSKSKSRVKSQKDLE